MYSTTVEPYIGGLWYLIHASYCSEAPYYKEKLIWQPRKVVLRVKWICNPEYHSAVFGGLGAGRDN